MTNLEKAIYESGGQLKPEYELDGATCPATVTLTHAQLQLVIAWICGPSVEVVSQYPGTIFSKFIDRPLGVGTKLYAPNAGSFPDNP